MYTCIHEQRKDLLLVHVTYLKRIHIDNSMILIVIIHICEDWECFDLLCTYLNSDVFLPDTNFVRGLNFYIKSWQNCRKTLMFKHCYSVPNTSKMKRLKDKLLLTIFLHLKVVLNFLSTNMHNDFVSSLSGLRDQWVRKLQYFAVGALVEPLADSVVRRILCLKNKKTFGG